MGNDTVRREYLLAVLLPQPQRCLRRQLFRRGALPAGDTGIMSGSESKSGAAAQGPEVSGVIRKSLGLSESERRLSAICEQSFLSMWSYPNLFRDQRFHNRTSGGKELCDLLVVCGHDIIIFSDKSSLFPNTGNLHTDWARWFRRSVLAGSRQVQGAERWIRTHPDRLFLDEACAQPFPFLPEPISNCQFFRVVVARKAIERCAATMGGTGTIAIDPDLVGSAHTQMTDPAYRPFAVGSIDPDQGFVHVQSAALLSEPCLVTTTLQQLQSRNPSRVRAREADEPAPSGGTRHRDARCRRIRRKRTPSACARLEAGRLRHA